jgi:F-type H+-transporting ATPase subunit c
MSDLATIALSLVNALPAEAAAAATDTAVQTAKITASGLLTIGKGVAFGAAAGGAGVGIGLVVAATLAGIARQPEQGGPLKTLMFIGIGFIEVFALIGFAYLFILK